MNERKFFQSAAILTITNGLLRLTDIWYRGYLCTHLGTAAMGLYQLNLSVFVLGVSLSAAGASFCTTRMVAEHGNDRRIIRKCLCFSLLISCSACLLFELLAPLFGPLLSGSLPLRILAIGLPFISVCACLKGCFLAEGKSGVPAVAEVVEQGATIGLGILFLDDFSSSITAVMTASTTAEAVGCIFIIFCYLKKMPHHKTCPAPIPSFCQIAAIGLPVLGGAGLRSFLFSVENLLIPTGLSSFCSREEALSQYGLVQGMMMPILVFPCTILSSATLLLIPELARSNSHGQPKRIRRITTKAFCLTSCFSFVCAALMAAFSSQLCQLFYKSQDAAVLVRIMVPLIPLLYLDSVVDGMLKGLNQQKYSLCCNLVDAVFRVCWCFFLIPILGLKGYLLLLFCSELLNSSLSISKLLNTADIEISPLWILTPASGAVLLYFFLSL